MSKSPFIHLRFHSAYSLLEGALPIAKAIAMAQKEEMPALGIADTNNLFGALEFANKAKKAGVQPIIGIELSVDTGLDRVNDEYQPFARDEFPSLCLIAMNQKGYENLMVLSSLAYEHIGNSVAHVKIDKVFDHNTGLICLTGGSKGPIDRLILSHHKEAAYSFIQQLNEKFENRLYVEIQRHGSHEQKIVEPQLIEIANIYKLPITATIEPFFPTEDDFEAHDALLAISEGRRISEDNRRQLTPKHNFLSQGNAKALFADLPSAIETTSEIAKRCLFAPVEHPPILPRYDNRFETLDEEADELDRQAYEGLKKRLQEHGHAEGYTQEDYDQRLALELSVIRRMQYPGYFLIVSDFIKWAKIHDIPVGPGRGSGAGSLVAWVLSITNIDPLRFGLLFERFLNPERVSMPDFDIDFCQDRRDEVIAYVRDKYGADKVAQIITFGSLQAKAVLRDVGRVLEMPYSQVDRLSKLVPSTPANPITLKEALKGEPKLKEERDSEPVVAQLMDMAIKLEGLYRHASTHAAGIVIGDRPLTELVPLYYDPRSDMPATQFNMKMAEAAGLVKFDFLGLKTLTVIQQTLALVKQTGVEINVDTIPLDDKETYELLSRGEAVGVFQLESSGMRKALFEMRPDRIEDIVALVALYRPGPMANIPVYCARKHGEEEPDYFHPSLEPVLKETFGVIVYQEQVMQIAQVMAGYSLGDADLLRRAMGKKIRSEMDKQRGRFTEGAVKLGTSEKKAKEVFDLMEKFADYGFNKSHAAAYAIIAYQTAYLKAHYPKEFLAASMTLDMGNTDKLKIFVEEARRMGIPVDSPCINNSEIRFSVKNGHIKYALAAVKGVGENAIGQIISARGDKPFTSLSDFGNRVDPSKLNKRMVENLTAAGAFDCLEPNRAKMYKNAGTLISYTQSNFANKSTGQGDIFGAADMAQDLPMIGCDQWRSAEKLDFENKAVGFFLSGHPLDDFKAVLEQKKLLNWAAFCARVRQGQTSGKLAATITQKQERRNRKGEKMGFIGLSDQTGTYEAMIFSDQLNKFSDLLEIGQNVLVTLNGRLNGDEIQVRLEKVQDLNLSFENLTLDLDIFLQNTHSLSHIKELLLSCEKGRSKIKLIYEMAQEKEEIDIELQEKYTTSHELISSIQILEGVKKVDSHAG